MNASRKAFTLIELLMVIVIIAVLSGMLLAGIAQARRMAKRTQATAAISSIVSALNNYYTDYHRWPKASSIWLK